MTRRTVGIIVLIALALGFLVLANLWVRQGELLTLAAQVSMSVPPVPAVAALLLMLGSLALLRRLGITRTDVMAVYCFLTLSVALTSGAAMRMFLPMLTCAQYFDAPENDYSEFRPYMHSWLLPQGDDVIRDYFEGSDSGAAPWGAWLPPLGIWLVFFTAFFGLLVCMALIFRPVWQDGEHLTYPVAEVPLLLAGYREHSRNMSLDVLFWIGFVLVCIHHLMNILNAFNPAVTSLGLMTDLGGLLQDHPMTALAPLQFRYKPIVFGVAYLMPTEVAISTVFFHLIYLKGLALGGAMAGVNLPGFPFMMEQAAGSFFGMAVLLVYAARERIAEVFRGLFRGEPRQRALPAITIICAGAIYLFWRVVGMGTPIFILYYVLMMAYALSTTRIRAEGGFASNWNFPLEQEQEVLINFGGSRWLKGMGGMTAMTALTLNYHLSRGYIPKLMAYMAESFKIADTAKISLRNMAILLMLGAVIGTTASWWMHIATAYESGANTLEGGSTAGGDRINIARAAYTNLADWALRDEGPNRSRAIATVGGFVMVLAVAGLRRAYLRFPLHPLGVLMAATGGGINDWGPLLSIVIIKLVVMRLGGMRLYRRLIPLFIGVVIGDFFSAGLVWSLIASFGGEGFNKYPVWY